MYLSFNQMMNYPMMNNQMMNNPMNMYNPMLNNNQANVNMMNFMINYTTLCNFFNNNNNLNNLNNESHMEIVTKTNKKSLPRNKENITHRLSPQYNGPRFNINFQTPTGFKVMMSVPINVKIGEILLEYLSVIGLGPEMLDNGIYFLFNGNKIKKRDYNITAQNIGMQTLSHIIVIDTKNLIGA